jgi:hypothetical protein
MFAKRQSLKKRADVVAWRAGLGQNQSFLIDRIDLGHSRLRRACWIFAAAIAAWATTHAICERERRRYLPPTSRWRMLGVCRREAGLLAVRVVPIAERWRVDLVEAIGAALIIWLLWTNAPQRVWGAFLFFVVYPILALILLRGSSQLGLPIVDTQLGGFSSRY